MTTTEIALPVEPKRDHNGRYLIPNPDKKLKVTSWQRATTLSGMLDDRWNLERYGLRTAAQGLVARPDLLALVATQLDPSQKQALNKTLEAAQEAGKGSAGANMGTALHKACERYDLGDTTFTMPGAAQADLEAYVKLRTTTGATYTMLPHGRPGIEVIVICPELEVAGTFDRLLDYPAEPLPIIDDIKTGESAIEWGMCSIAIQLAIYAHGSHIFDPATGELTPMPRVNLEKAFVTHLPAGTAQAAMWEVDIAAGWEAAKHAAFVRDYRTRGKRGDFVRHVIGASSVKSAPQAAQADDPFDGLPSSGPPGSPLPASTTAVDLFADFGAPASSPSSSTGLPADLFAKHVTPASTAPAADPFADFASTTSSTVAPVTAVDVRPPRQIRYDNLKRRLSTLKSIDGAAEHMARLWPTDATGEKMPGINNPHFDPLDDDLDKIEAVLIEVEKQHSAPFDPIPAPPAEIPAPVERPAQPAAIDEGPDLEQTDLDALKLALKDLDLERQQWVAGIARQCGEAKSSINLRERPSSRRFGIARALLLAALANLDDKALELSARVVTGEDERPFGELIGKLSTDEAARLADLACAIEAGEIRYVTAVELATMDELDKAAIPHDRAVALAGDLTKYKPTT